MSERQHDRIERGERVGSDKNDEFTLWDLRVEVVAGDKPMVCNHRVGDSFELSGEDLRLPTGQSFPIYPLAAILPLLPAKQRDSDPHDWMSTDAEVACPDPHCGARFRIRRTGRRTFRHSEVSAVPLPSSARDTVGEDTVGEDTVGEEPDES